MQYFNHGIYNFKVHYILYHDTTESMKKTKQLIAYAYHHFKLNLFCN